MLYYLTAQCDFRLQASVGPKALEEVSRPACGATFTMKQYVEAAAFAGLGTECFN